ncbi:MAG: hypothetical protein PHW95_00380 [Patescibacteria group bacterium]|nr:hypothetical protein [Patescibacteria group bacterium]
MNKNIFVLLLVIFLFTSFLLGVIYVIGQQILRAAANDPQIQLSEDIASALNSGADINSLIAGHIDIASSLAPYIIIFDKSGQPINGNGYLNNSWPGVPKGILEFVDTNGEDRITWQPQAGVRSATVINKYNSGYVLAARSLREVEVRENLLLQSIMMFWLALTAGFTLFYILFITRAKKINN